MKFLSKILWLCGLIICTTVNASPFTISEAEINHYLAAELAKKVPVEQEVGIPKLLQLKYRLHQITTKIGQTPEKRVEIFGNLSGVLTLRGKTYNAQLQLEMDTVPYYEAKEGALYLKDVRLIQWSIIPDKHQNELAMFLPLISDGVTSLLNRTPIYTLDENKTKEALVRKFGKAIVVEKGQLRLEVGIF